MMILEKYIEIEMYRYVNLKTLNVTMLVAWYIISQQVKTELYREIHFAVFFNQAKFRLYIWHQTELRLMPNQSEKCN